MKSRGYLIGFILLLVAVLSIQPVLSADNLDELLSGKNVTSVTNYTADLEKDAATKYFNYGQQSVNIRDYPNALTYYDQALAENLSMLKKTDALLYLYQGKTYTLIQLERYSDAVTTADAGIALYPKDAMLWNNKGWALQNLKRNQEALAAYDKAVSLDAGYTNALLNKGNLLSEMGKYTEAAAAFTRANETDPFNIAASDGLEAARKGEAGSTQMTSIVLVIVLIAAAGIVVWYVRFRKPSEPAPSDKKKKSKK